MLAWTKRKISFIFFKLFKRQIISSTQFYLSRNYARDIIYKLSNKSDLLFSNIGKQVYLVPGGDEAIGRHLYIGGSFDCGAVEKVLDFLGPKHKKYFIDIGANLGHICIPALAQYGFEKVIAIEPGGLNFRLLNLNIFLNGLSEKCTLYNNFLGEKNEDHCYLAISDSNIGDHRIQLGFQNQIQSEKVISKTLDSIMPIDADANNCLIWLDVQGYEGFVLSGGTNVIKNKIPICLEFCPKMLKANGSYELLKRSLLVGTYENCLILQIGKKIDSFTSECLDRISDELEKLPGEKHYDLLLF